MNKLIKDTKKPQHQPLPVMNKLIKYDKKPQPQPQYKPNVANYPSLKLKNVDGAVVFATRIIGNNGKRICALDAGAEIKSHDLTLKCNFKHIEHTKINGVFIKRFDCNGTFTKKENLPEDLLHYYAIDFMLLKIAEPDQPQFIEFLKKHTDHQRLRDISLPRLTDVNLCAVTDWIMGLGNLTTFNYLVDPNNKIQSHVVKLIQELITKRAFHNNLYPLQHPVQPNITFSCESIDFKESKYDADQNLIIIIFHPDINILELRSILDVESIRLKMDQIQALKYKGKGPYLWKLTGDYSTVDTVITIFGMNCNDLVVSDDKVNEFIDFISKQKIEHLSIPKLGDFDFSEVRKKILQIKTLTTFQSNHGDYSSKLKELERVVTYDINEKQVQQIKKKYKINDDKKE